MSKIRKKVLLIGPMPPPPGGVSTHLMRLLQHADSISDLSLSVLDLRKRQWFGTNTNSKNWLRIISEFLSADIVHIHTSKPIKVRLGRIVKIFGKKLVYTQHNLREIDDAATQEMFSIAHHIFLVQEPLHINEKYRAKMSILPAYLPAIKKTEVPEWFQNEFQKFPNVMLSLAYHESGKSTEFNGKDLYGFDQIMEAVEGISSLRKLNAWMLILIDPNGTLEQHYSERSKQVESQTGVKIVYVSSAVDVVSLLPFCKIFIRATWSDGDALSIREALSTGIPAIASDCVPRPQGVILYKTGNVKDLEEKLLAVIQYPYRITFQQPDFSHALFAVYCNL